MSLTTLIVRISRLFLCLDGIIRRYHKHNGNSHVIKADGTATPSL